MMRQVGGREVKGEWVESGGGLYNQAKLDLTNLCQKRLVTGFIPPVTRRNTS